MKPVRLTDSRELPLDKRWHSYLCPMNSYPAWWDRAFHTRPRRAKEKAMILQIATGSLDPDNAAWPPCKKPHIYYW